jgi:hypothetical protein
MTDELTDAEIAQATARMMAYAIEARNSDAGFTWNQSAEERARFTNQHGAVIRHILEQTGDTPSPPSSSTPASPSPASDSGKPSLPR